MSGKHATTNIYRYATSAFLSISIVSLLLPSFSIAKGNTAESEKIIRIGLRANRGIDIALKRWQPTADYLSENLPGYRFKLIPHEINSTLNQAVSRNEFEFVLTNPAAYVELRIRYGLEKMVTLANKRNDQGYTVFGSVIFTHRDNHDINTFQDLKGKSFIAADELGFGGWRVAWYELLLNDIDPYRDFKKLSFAGGLQQRVVHAVLNRTIDAGTVRTDMLERLARRGKINLSEVKVLGKRTNKTFPFVHSTRLYPEWPFAKLKHTDNVLARNVTILLLKINAEHPAAIAGKYTGWETGHHYDDVENLLRNLKVGPYSMHGRPLIKEVFVQYWYWLVVIFIVLVLLLTLYIKMTYINSRLRITENTLLESNSKLKDMALVDGLTGLGNRRTLNEFIEQVWGQACRDQIPVCVLMMDVDYFKDYNDTYGHLAGDDCLKIISAKIDEYFRRSGEIAIRYGGEEFLVFKTHCELDTTRQHADYFRNIIRDMNIEHSSSKVDSVITISIGIATTTPDKDSNPHTLIKQADMALYQAKLAGRNRVAIYQQNL